jgi:hypothetical protein
MPQAAAAAKQLVGHAVSAKPRVCACSLDRPAAPHRWASCGASSALLRLMRQPSGQYLLGAPDLATQSEQRTVLPLFHWLGSKPELGPGLTRSRKSPRRKCVALSARALAAAALRCAGPPAAAASPAAPARCAPGCACAPARAAACVRSSRRCLPREQPARPQAPPKHSLPP